MANASNSSACPPEVGVLPFGILFPMQARPYHGKPLEGKPSGVTPESSALYL